MNERGVHGCNPPKKKKEKSHKQNTLKLDLLSRFHRSPAENRYLSLPLSLSQRQALQPPWLVSSLRPLPPPLPGKRPHCHCNTRSKRLGRLLRRPTPRTFRVQLRRRHLPILRPAPRPRYQGPRVPAPRLRPGLYHQPASPFPPRHRPRKPLPTP